jgi:hypothetical protein
MGLLMLKYMILVVLKDVPLVWKQASATQLPDTIDLRG